jgi:hypothetical protein
MSDTETLPNPEDLEVVPGSPEYNEMMRSKFLSELGYETDNQTDEEDTNEGDDADIPALPEGGQAKFYNAQTGEYNWQAHARELEYRASKGQKPKADEGAAPEGDKPTEDAPAPDGEVADIVTKAGLSMETLEQTLQTNGSLTDEQRAALVKTGIPEALVRSYETMYAKAYEAQVKESLDYVGGEQEWQRIHAWAATNLTPAERDQYEVLLAGPSWQVAVDALKSRMGSTSKTAREGSLAAGAGPSNSSPVGYRSRDEMKRDMSNPLYQSDAKFRERVMQKMQSATWDLD